MWINVDRDMSNFFLIVVGIIVYFFSILQIINKEITENFKEIHLRSKFNVVSLLEFFFGKIFIFNRKILNFFKSFEIILNGGSLNNGPAYFI